MDPRLRDLVEEGRQARRELRLHANVRKDIAEQFRTALRRAQSARLRLPDMRIINMTQLVLEAHTIAVADQDGLTIDIITDALEHLHVRMEREVMPHLIESK